jgi:hypothetical protein
LITVHDNLVDGTLHRTYLGTPPIRHLPPLPTLILLLGDVRSKVMLCVRCNVAFLVLTTASCFSAKGFDIKRIFYEKRANTTEVVGAPVVVPPSQYL